MSNIRKRRLEAGKGLIFPNIGKNKTIEDFQQNGETSGGTNPLGGTVADPSAPGSDLTNPDAVTRMPDPNDPNYQEELRKKYLQQYLEAGRLGTILSPRTKDAYGITRVASEQ